MEDEYEGRTRKYGDYSPPRDEKPEGGGYFGQKFGVKKQKGEFEGSDEEGLDDYTNSAYSKPTRGGVKSKRGGKKQALAMNDDDFPTL